MPIFRSALISRRPGLDEAAFRDHWIRVHGDLASRLPGVGTYRQNHIVERLYEDASVPVQSIDGVSQLAFDSIAAMEQSDASPQYAKVKADIPFFQGAITILVLESEVLHAGAGGQPGDPGAKLLWLSTRRAGVAPKGVRQRWLGQARQTLADLTADLPGVRRHVQNFVVDRSHPVHAGVPAGDAGAVETVTEMWFDSADALRAAVHSEAGRRLIHADPMLRPFAVYRIVEIHII